MGQRSTGYAVYKGNAAATHIFDPKMVVSPGKYSMADGDDERFQSLWRWGQYRLAHFPTIKQSEQRTLEQMRHQHDQGTDGVDSEQNLNGDLTVMVTAIIPMPEEDRTHCTPMGWLRIWDGTGISDSDRYAFNRSAQGVSYLRYTYCLTS